MSGFAGTIKTFFALLSGSWNLLESNRATWFREPHELPGGLGMGASSARRQVYDPPSKNKQNFFFEVNSKGSFQGSSRSSKEKNTSNRRNNRMHRHRSIRQKDLFAIGFGDRALPTHLTVAPEDEDTALERGQVGAQEVDPGGAAKLVSVSLRTGRWSDGCWKRKRANSAALVTCRANVRNFECLFRWVTSGRTGSY